MTDTPSADAERLAETRWIEDHKYWIAKRSTGAWPYADFARFIEIIAHLTQERDALTVVVDGAVKRQDVYEKEVSQLIQERDTATRRAEALEAEVENLRADADNDAGHVQSLKAAISQICEAIGFPRGNSDWPDWIAALRAKFAAPHAADHTEWARAPSAIDFARSWRNNAWGDERFAEFCRELDALLTAAERAGAEKMRALDEAVIEAARNLTGPYEESRAISGNLWTALRDSLAARDAALTEREGR